MPKHALYAVKKSLVELFKQSVIIIFLLIGVYTQTSYFADWINEKFQTITTTPMTTTTMTTTTTEEGTENPAYDYEEY